MTTITIELDDQCADLLDDVAITQKLSGISEFLQKEAIAFAEANALLYGRDPDTFERIQNEDGGYDG